MHGPACSLGRRSVSSGRSGRRARPSCSRRDVDLQRRSAIPPASAQWRMRSRDASMTVAVERAGDAHGEQLGRTIEQSVLPRRSHPHRADEARSAGSTPSGRSVVSRSTEQRRPKRAASSWTPPESREHQHGVPEQPHKFRVTQRRHPPDSGLIAEHVPRDLRQLRIWMHHEHDFTIAPSARRRAAEQTPRRAHPSSRDDGRSVGSTDGPVHAAIVSRDPRGSTAAHQ